MKLGEISTENSASILCRLAELFERIDVDEKTSNAIESCFRALRGNGDNEIKAVSMMRAGTSLITQILGSHFDDMVEIISLMTGKSADVVRKQCVSETINDIKSFVDEDFVSFFKLSVAQMRNA